MGSKDANGPVGGLLGGWGDVGAHKARAALVRYRYDDSVLPLMRRKKGAFLPTGECSSIISFGGSGVATDGGLQLWLGASRAVHEDCRLCVYYSSVESEDIRN